MKLMTKEIEKKIPALYATDGQDVKDVAVKFFTPWANGTWYAVEGEKLENGDWEFFGMVDLQEKEFGYFLLSQLEAIAGPFGLKIERDRHFEGQVTIDKEVIGH
ncbi:MAG: DUF2958 domain-containing protein [Planctomycetota bacterium]|jgi:hypothetical protein